jgi:hypothetical protein
MQIARMRIPVFVSAPSPDNLSPSQEASAEIINRLVRRYKLDWRALGRSDYPNDLPLKEVLRMVRRCSGGVILRGVFDVGSTEVFIHQMPTKTMPRQALDDLDSVFQNWVWRVRANYYGD